MAGTVVTPTGTAVTLNVLPGANVVGALDDAGATGAVTTADTVMAYIKQLITRGGVELDTTTLGAQLKLLQALTPATFVPGLGYPVTKTENVNTATGVDLFTVTGKVLLTLWTGEVTNALHTTVTDYKLRVKTSNIDLCAASDLNSAAIGFLFQMNGDAGDTLVNTASATETADTNGKGLANRVVGKAGGSLVLQSNRTAGASGDAIIHTLFYLPLEASAAVAAA